MVKVLVSHHIPLDPDEVGAGIKGNVDLVFTEDEESTKGK